MDKFKFNFSSGRLQCLAEQGNTAWLRIHTIYFLLYFFYGADLHLFTITANCYGIKSYRFSDAESKERKLLRSTQANNKYQSDSHTGTTLVHDITTKAKDREMSEYWVFWSLGKLKIGGARSRVNSSRLPGEWQQKLSSWSGIKQRAWKQGKSFLAANKIWGNFYVFYLTAFVNKSHA